MTIKEIVEITGLSKQTILNKVKEKFPTKIIHGKTTRLNQDESISIVNELRVEVSKNLTVESKNLTVENNKTENNYVTKQDLIDFGASIVQEMFKQVLPLMQNNFKHLEIKQDYYSILGYMNFMNIDEARFSEMICYGKEASKISRELNKEIRKIPDERFGHVNSYHVDVLKKVFEV